jgi:putative oxidoreductase
MRSRLLSSGPFQLDLGLLLLRLVAGGLMLTHGLPKLQMILAGNYQFGDPIGLGTELSLILVTFAEVVCAALVIIGLLTKLATIPVIIDMMVAFFVVHQADPLEKKEVALIFLVLYIVILLTGPGRYSVDHGMGKRY